MNPYQVLGVSPGDSEETIKKAYRKAAKECHPDTHPGDKKAEERFKQVGDAYRILSDAKKREAYDRQAAQKNEQQASSAKRAKTQAGAGFINPGDIEKEFEKFMFGGSMKKKNGSEKQQNIKSMDVSSLFERYMGFK